MRDATPEPPAPTPSATTCANPDCGHALNEHGPTGICLFGFNAAVHRYSEGRLGKRKCNCKQFVPPASAPAATAGTEDRIHSGPECVRCGRREVWHPDGSCHFFAPKPAAPTGEEAENADAILTDAVIGAFYDAVNDAKQDACGLLFYRWNDPTPAWQEGIGKAFFRDFALRIAGHVASRYAAEYTAQATALAALRDDAARWRFVVAQAQDGDVELEVLSIGSLISTANGGFQTRGDLNESIDKVRAALAPRQTTEGHEHG